ncbi:MULTISPECIES: copper resistance protein CopC [unclassified Streptomyces]|uniref:copper resistance CopC family protein n=1 Tax=unclassified Streptomyces TaxID=2593676 RepID=UPI0036E2D145
MADSPKSLVLVFDQPVSLRGSSVRVEPSARLGTTALSQGNQAVTVPVRSALAEGVHTVNWQVTARDGDIMTGSYRFAVGPRTLALASGQTTAAKDAAPTTILRWLLFATSRSCSAKLRADAAPPGSPTPRPAARAPGPCRPRSPAPPPRSRWPSCSSGTAPFPPSPAPGPASSP